MKFNPDIHHRQSIRLKGYDYGQAERLYCITICAWQRQCIFSNIQNGEMHLTSFGEIVRDEWFKTPSLRPNVELGEFVVMPNHIHGILAIVDHDRRGTPPRAHPGQPITPQPIPMQPISDQGQPTDELSIPDDPLSEQSISQEPISGEPTDSLSVNRQLMRDGGGPIITGGDAIRGAGTRGEGTPPRAPTGKQSTLRVVEAFGKPTPNTIPTIVRGYKAAVTKQINLLRDCPGCPVWQRNYYEHLIRDKNDYLRIAAYILDNPRRWQEDSLNDA